MALRKYRPTTPSQRTHVSVLNEELDPVAKKPLKKLTRGLPSKAGRSAASGRISVRRRGGGHKRLLRTIDFRRDKIDIPGTVQSIEYDPNRSANIALVVYRDGEKRYILAPRGLKVGIEVVSGENGKPDVGNFLPISHIPLGTSIHNIEMHKGKGGQIARGAGVAALLMSREGNYANLKLPSGEIRRIHVGCGATIGVVGNADNMNISLGKAGRARWMGRRPKVRGVVMNPVDHPHGGGEGRSSGGRHPVSPWGQPTKGYKTRNRNKPSSRYIEKRRK